MYYLTTNKNEIKYYKETSDLLLKKAKPLMEIYRESNIKEYHLFLKKDENIECDRTRYISSLPLFNDGSKKSVIDDVSPSSLIPHESVQHPLSIYDELLEVS